MTRLVWRMNTKWMDGWSCVRDARERETVSADSKRSVVARCLWNTVILMSSRVGFELAFTLSDIYYDLKTSESAERGNG